MTKSEARAGINEIREYSIYCLKKEGDCWFVFNRLYNKERKAYKLSESQLNRIADISKNLQGGETQNNENGLNGIWLYNDSIHREYHKKKYRLNLHLGIQIVRKIINE